MARETSEEGAAREERVSGLRVGVNPEVRKDPMRFAEEFEKDVEERIRTHRARARSYQNARKGGWAARIASLRVD